MEKLSIKGKTSWWQWLLMLALALVLLYFAFRGVKWSDLVEGVKSCNFWWIGVSMIASIFGFVLRGLRWRLIMLPLNKNITRREAYDGVTIMYLSNFALPRMGEFVRCGVISATKKASFQSVLGTVVLERSWDMVSYAVILLSIIFIRWDKFGGFMQENIWTPFVGSLPFNAIWLIVGILAIMILLCLWIYKKREVLKQKKLFLKIYNILKGLWDGLIAGFKTEQRGRFFFYTALIWTCYWVMSIATIKAFPNVAHLNGVDALFLMVIGGLGWIIPVQGGIGAYHFILALALSSLYGIPQTSGVVFATISHESQAFTMLLCGALSLISISLSKRVSKKKIN